MNFTTTLDQNSQTTSVAVQFENGQVNIYDLVDESGEDYKTLCKKIFKQQNYYPENVEIKKGFIVKELPKPIDSANDHWIEFQTNSFSGKFHPYHVKASTSSFNKFSEKIDYQIEMFDGSIFKISEEAFEKLQKAF